MEIINCRALSTKIRDKICNDIKALPFTPTLAVIYDTNNPSSLSYAKSREKICSKVGIKVIQFQIHDSYSTEDLIELISNLNDMKEIQGILVQVPLPSRIDSRQVLDTIDYRKDIYGLSTRSKGELYDGKPLYYPCTPLGILSILDSINFQYDGANVVVIGRSNIVGKPIANMLTNKNATVTLCHSHTREIAQYTRNADLIICAVGIPFFLTADMVEGNPIIIDCGINMVDGKLVGDVDIENMPLDVAAITPVPNGVGVMTSTALMQNMLKVAKLQMK